MSRSSCVEHATKRDFSCNRCRADSQHEWQTKNKHKAQRMKRNSAYKKLYGITLEDYEEMFEAQGGRCAICNGPPGARRLHVDHDHETGVVRGLLCMPCNSMLAGARDNPSTLAEAMTYLKRVR